MPFAQIHLEAIDHEKIVILLPSDGVRWTWLIAIVRGKMRNPSGQWSSLEHMRRSINRPMPHLQALLDARLLDQAEDGTVQLHDWKDWQEDKKDPTGARRQKEFRDRHRNASTPQTVTRYVTPERNAECNVTTNVKESPPSPSPEFARPEGEAAGADFSSSNSPAAPAELTTQQLEAAAELVAHDVQIAEQLVCEFPDLTADVVRDIARKADGDGGRIVTRIRNRHWLKHRKAPPLRMPRPTFQSEARGGNAAKPLSAEEIRQAVAAGNPELAAKLKAMEGRP